MLDKKNHGKVENTRTSTGSVQANIGPFEP